MNNIDIQDLISAYDAAVLVGVIPQTIYNWINSGKLQEIVIADRKFVSKREVMKIKDSGK